MRSDRAAIMAELVHRITALGTTTEVAAPNAADAAQGV